MAKYCIYCGNELKKNDSKCSKCGSVVEEEKETKKKTSSEKDVVEKKNTVTSTSTTNGLAIAGFVVSIISSLICCGSLNIISLILSIVGLVKSKDLNGSGKGLAIAGIVISIISIVLFIIILILLYGVSIIGNAYAYSSL